jgi:signal transduction histidine kinase
MANIKMASEMLELYLQRLPNRHELPSNIERYLQILKKECQRETGLINDLLDLARLESRDIPLNMSSLQLDTWIFALAKTFEERAQKQRQRFQVHIPTLVIETELTYLERIVTELLHNACKYTPAGELIQISAQQEGDRLILSVCNSGVEIPMSECDRIFDKFYRIPNNDPWKQGGTGLGLALIKKLVQQLHGTIQLHSAQSQTCFIIVLPMRY